MTWFDEMVGSGSAPDDLRAWAAGQPSRADAWTQCPRPDWQLWLAAHAPDLTLRDQRKILGGARELDELLPSRPWWIVSWMFPVPTKLDVISAWGREPATSSPRRTRSLARIALSLLVGKDDPTLGLEQKLKASGAAFVAALVIGIVIDRLWLADYWPDVDGMSRTLMQGVVCTAAWLLFIPVMRAIWRTRIKRGLDGLTFERAFELIWPRTVRLTKRFTVEDQPKRAHGVRIDLGDLGKRAFS